MRKTQSTEKEGKTCCECGGTSLKYKMTTFPFRSSLGKTILVNRTPLYECLDCHHLIPTRKGREKLDRCLGAFMSLLS